jgi:hypothetical protein
VFDCIIISCLKIPLLIALFSDISAVCDNPIDECALLL